jgi:hypothetical protein
MFEKLDEAVRYVESAEKMAPAGSFMHGQYVQAALLNAWPTIQAYVEIERRNRTIPMKGRDAGEVVLEAW